MARIQFTYGSESLTFEGGRAFPEGDQPNPNVVTGLSDGGQMYAYRKGIIEVEIPLVLINISYTDYIQLLDWFKNTCVAALNEFTFTDENGREHAVRWIDERFPLMRTGVNAYGGTIMLREEQHGSEATLSDSFGLTESITVSIS